MGIYVLQHAPFEGAGIIASLCQQEGYHTTVIRLYQGDSLPTSYDDITLIVVMGGSMSVFDDAIYPWLNDEKAWLQQVIDAGIRIIGVCLGAQLLALALGGRVMKNRAPEIGWFAVNQVQKNTPWATLLPQSFHAFHWHGETFSLPTDAQLLASSEGCMNQAFLWKNQVLGLQFHLEVSKNIVHDLCLYCPDDLTAGDRVQTEAVMLKHHDYFIQAHRLMQIILRYMLH